MNNKKENTKYPYARLKAMIDFMEFVREPNWKPEKIDAELLKRLGIAKGKEREAIHALTFLGLVSEGGTPTHEIDNLKQDYQGTLKRLVEEKYTELFNLIPARLANQERLVKFFGTSVDTAEYQAKLFVWFCNQSGIELPNVEEHFHRARFDKEKSQ
jgi:hypothetical protein